MKAVMFISLLLALVFSGMLKATSAGYSVNSPLARELVPQNGLAQNIVTSMTEDQFGRFWIGTQDGVNIVDGNNIHLLSALSRKAALSGKVVTSLVADGKDSVWIATTQGLDKINSRDFSVQPVRYLNQAILDIRMMQLLDENQLAILVKQSLLLLNINTGDINTDSVFAGKVLNFGQAADGLVLQTADGFFHYKTGGEVQQLVVPDTVRRRAANYLLAAQRLWLITEDQQVVSCHRGACQPVTLPAIADTEGLSMQMTLHQNRLYFVQDENIVVYSLDDTTVRLISPQLPVKAYTTVGFTAGIKVLSSGEIAVIRRQGLLLVPDNYHNINSFPQFSPLTGSEIYALTAVAGSTEPEQNLLIATDGRLELYQIVEHSNRLLQQLDYPQRLVPALFVKLNNELLLSTLNAGTFRVDLIANQLLPWQPQLAALGTLVDVLPLDNSHYLLLYHQQLILLQRNEQHYVQLWSSKLPTTKTAKMIYHNQQLMIAAYQQGLLSSPWQDWHTPPEHWQTTAAGNPILDLRLSATDQLQVMTAEQGVQLLNMTTAEITIAELSATQQLRNTTAVCSVDLSDDIWIAATHDGLTLYNNSNQLLRHLTLYDGLVQREFNQYQCGRINNKAYFAGENGLNVIGYSDATIQRSAKLQFTHSLVDGEYISLDTNHLQLTEPNTIVLNYSYAPYPALAPVRFQYRLEPGNDEWFDTTATTLRYTQLAIGQYQLSLRALSIDGALSESVQLSLQIKPQFWRSPQAYALYSLLLISLIWLYFRQRWQIQQAKLQVAKSQHRFQQEYTDRLEDAVRLRTAKLELQQQEFLLMQQEKIAFLTTSSHDLKNLSALIQLNLADLHKYILPTGQDSWQNVHSSCKLLNNLVDDILELSKLKAGVVTPALQAVNLPYLLRQVYQPFKLMAEERQINLQLSTSEELLVLTDPYLLARLLMNLLDNALKNLSAGHSVQLELKKRYRTSRQVYLLVRDSGPGLPQHMRRHWGEAFQRGASGYQGSGLGLSIVKKIAELLVLPISLYSSDRGTCFELRLQQTEPADQQTSISAGYAAIIDSDPQARQFMYYELVRRGYQVAVYTHATDFARSGQNGLKVLISDIHFKASDHTIAHLALLKSSLGAEGKLIFVSSDASVRDRLPDETQLYFMLKPVKRSRLAWLLAKGF